MSIQQELRDELTRAMKAKETATVNVIRQVESEIGVARSAPGFSGEVDDELYQSVIATYVKKMDRARSEFANVGDRGAEQVAKLTFEIDYLGRWLPEAVSEEETAEIVAAAIEETGADDPKMAGRVIGHVMRNNDGLDGALVGRLVRSQLGVRE